MITAPPLSIVAYLGDRLRAVAGAPRDVEGRALNVAFVKQATGGERISARRMRQDFFEFWPTHKLVLSTNRRPRIKETSEAIWERVHLVPWSVFIPEAERDPKLSEKLRAEGEGILAWIVAGCTAWQCVGLNPPAAVRVATQAYRAEEDTLGAFLTECCVAEERFTVDAGPLYQAYRKWAEENNERPLSQRTLGIRLQERGFRPDRTYNRRFWRGLALLDMTHSDASYPIAPKNTPHRTSYGYDASVASDDDGEVRS